MADLDPVVAHWLARAAAIADPLQLLETVCTPGPDVFRVEDADADGVRVRIYWPKGEGRHPVHLHVHGGSWQQGSIEDYPVDAHCRTMCRDAGVAVISIDHRLAPEFPFPAAIEDCWRVLLWADGDPRFDSSRITAGGHSSGANLVGALALVTQSRSGPRLQHLLLEVASMDLSMDYSTWADYAAYGFDIESRPKVLEAYLGDLALIDHPLASPARADLTGLPDACVLLAELDATRGGAEHFAERLAATGAAVELEVFPGQVHLSPVLTAVSPMSQEWQRRAIDAVRRASHPTANSPDGEQT